MQGAICAIKKIELDTKLKREKDNVSGQTVGAGKDASDKAKTLKKAEGDEPPHAIVYAAKAALEEARKATNEVQE